LGKARNETLCQKKDRKTLPQKPKSARSNRTQITHVNSSKIPTLGLPRLLKVISREKKTVPYALKLQPSLARVLKSLGPDFVRRAVIEKLGKEAK